jgi:hypothetical protein
MNLADLVVERGGRLSLGRVSWWLCLAVALAKTWTAGDVPTTLYAVLVALLGYLYGKKWTKPTDAKPAAGGDA